MVDFVDVGISIIIAFGVGISIMLYQRKMNKKIDALIIKQNKIIGEDYQREINWKSHWGQKITTDLKSIKNFHEILHKWLVDYANDRSESKKETLLFSIERLESIMRFHTQNIQNITKIENYLKDPSLSTHLIGITNNYQNTFKIDAEWAWVDDGINQQIISLEEKNAKLEELIQRMQKETTNLLHDDSNV